LLSSSTKPEIDATRATTDTAVWALLVTLPTASDVVIVAVPGWPALTTPEALTAATAGLSLVKLAAGTVMGSPRWSRATYVRVTVLPGAKV
jgi:hypothetical protein